MAKSTSFKQQCPICEAMVPIKDESLIGKKITCPTCKGPFVVKASANGAAAKPDGGSKKNADEDTPPPSRKSGDTAKLKPALKKKGAKEDIAAQEDLEEVRDQAGEKGKTAAKTDTGKKAAQELVEEEIEDLSPEDVMELAKKAKSDAGSESEAGEEGSKAKKKKKAKKGKSSLLALLMKHKLVAGGGLGGLGMVLLIVFLFLNSGSGKPKDQPKRPSGGPGPGEVSQVNPPDGNSPSKPEPKPEPKPATPLTDDGMPGLAGPEFTNLLPNDTEHVLHLHFKQIMSSPLGEIAFNLPGAFRDDDLKARLGFSVKAIDEILRAESYSAKWAFNVIHTTEALDETAIKKALGLVEPAGGPIKGLKYYQVGKFNPYLEQFARLSITPRSLSEAALLESRPQFVYVVNRQTLIVADHGPLQDFLLNGGKFNQHPEAILGTPSSGDPKPDPGTNPPPKPDPRNPQPPLPPGGGQPGGIQPPVQPPPLPMGQTRPGPEPQPEPPKEQPKEQPPSSPMTPTPSSSATYMTINPRLKAMLQRMEPRGVKGGKALWRSATELNMARSTKNPKAPVQSQLRHIWDVTQLVQRRKTPILVLGTSLHKRADRVYHFQNGMDCTSENDAKAFGEELLEQAVPKMIGFFDAVLGHKVTLEKPMPPDQANPNPEQQPQQPQQPGENPQTPPLDPEELAEEAKASRVRVLVNEKYVRLALDLVLLAQVDWSIFHSAAALTVCGLRTELDAAASLDQRQRLAQAALALGEKGLPEQGIGAGRYPPGAFSREGAEKRTAREPLNRVSWMAGLLPYLGHDLVYRKIHFDKAWKEPANWLAARHIVPEFLDPHSSSGTWRVNYPGLPLEVGATHYVGISGIGIDAAEFNRTDMALVGKLGVFGYEGSATLEQIKNGRGQQNTILLIQVRADGPEGLTPWIAGGGSTVRGVPEKNSFEPFVGKHGNLEGTYVAMADGSVRFIKKGIKDEDFQTMVTVGPKPNGFDIDKVSTLVKPDTAKNEPRKTAAGKEPPKGEGSQEPTGAPMKRSWQEFKSPDGTFKVQFPGTPIVAIRDLPAPLGGGKLHLYTLDFPPSKDQLGVLTLTAPEIDGKKMDAAGMIQLGKQVGLPVRDVQVKSEKDITLGSHPGKEITCEIGKETVLVVRVYAVNNQIYILTTGVGIGSERAALVPRFLDSFALIPS